MEKTQKSIILDHLKMHGSITPAFAYSEYGIYRLSAIIKTLREEGIFIKTEIMQSYNRNRNKKSKFAKYVYSKTPVGENYEISFG